ncbi:hypothetical protein [Dysgonomonas sp. 511]|uniref:hypothetical protein n=1 Tax=Dysgonomonas sp. 511 TaxID=2302930 RepID=UPI0013D2A01D|nr:hypothetical protein [Dysgonomonas sp. 511]
MALPCKEGSLAKPQGEKVTMEKEEKNVTCVTFSHRPQWERGLQATTREKKK